MEINITIKDLDTLSNAITSLAQAISGAVHNSTDQMPKDITPVQQAVVSPVQQPETVSAVSQQQPIVEPQQPQVASVTQTVATNEMSYTLDNLSLAATTLMDKGMMEQLRQLLQQFGVLTLPELPAEQYGAFATALRGLGAQI